MLNGMTVLRFENMPELARSGGKKTAQCTHCALECVSKATPPIRLASEQSFAKRYHPAHSAQKIIRKCFEISEGDNLSFDEFSKFVEQS